MKNFSKNNIVLIRYPFTNLVSSKVRPAVIISSPIHSEDLFIVPLTSKTNSLINGEFSLKDWQASGLNISTAIKRGIFTVHKALVLKIIGSLSPFDANKLKQSLKQWLELE